MKIQLLAAAALAVFTAGPGAVTASSLRGAVADSEDLDLALEYAADYPKVDVYSDYDFDPEEEDADLDLDLYDEDGEEDGEDMDLVSYWRRRRHGGRISRNRQWRGRNSYRNSRWSRRGGWRNGGWRNGGWRNGGWRNGGWRNGGWRNNRQWRHRNQRRRRWNYEMQ